MKYKSEREEENTPQHESPKEKDAFGPLGQAPENISLSPYLFALIDSAFLNWLT